MSESDKNKLESSLKQFGLVDPIIVNLKNNTIIGGHMRFDALLNNKELETLNLIRLGDIGWAFTETDLKVKDADHEKALNLSLNKISGDWDNDKLRVILSELSETHFNLELTGFDDLELKKLDINLTPLNNDSIVVEDDFVFAEDVETDI